ncbi:hypothetical protein AB6805_25285 [Chitinophaga sp. RCC_12]|uniref:hypothetical protein n=1 Tax=Chitinophaga sp. RCC_12 TaxID=3239226 RepID=UPI00352615A9
MAKQSGLFQFTGKLDNVIGYRRNGSYFVRTMPVTVKQTAATRQASRNFGIASRKAKLIRQAITPQLEINRDGSLVNRLNKALITAGKDQWKHIEGFRFNKHTGIDKFFPLQPVIQNGRLKIPAQTLPPQDALTHLEITVVATRISFVEQRITRQHSTTIKVDINAPFNGLELDASIPGKGILFVVLQVTARKGSDLTRDRRFMAADILFTGTPETKKETPKRKQQIPDIRKVLPYKPAKIPGAPALRTANKQQRE